MEKALFVVLLISSCLVMTTRSLLANNNYKINIRQTESLGKLYREKFKSNSTIDRSYFNVSHHRHHHHHHHDEEDQKGLKEKDRIEKLPGQPNMKKNGFFKQYGGYVTVNQSAGRAFYYYFAEATHNSDHLPLVLWLNGGPGCSSLGYGAMEELGPFRVHSDGKTLYHNRFAWNNAANVLFLESPAGVGFSYSNTSADYDSSGDKMTASDNYVFLVNWLQRFPEYKNTDLFITGESYAGHYVPQLAHTILYHNNNNNNTNTFINLKGILIGNAAIDDEGDVRGMYEYFGSHALISDETSSIIQKYCNFSPEATSQPTLCDDATASAEDDIKSIDIFNIYAPLCSNPNLTTTTTTASSRNSDQVDPCSDYYVYAYLNRPDVQEALHANLTKLPYDWQPCSNVLRNWSDSPASVLPLLKELVSSGLRVWIYSGDTDGRIPVTSTQNSIKKLKYKVKSKWHPWFLSGEVGGYTQVYKGNMRFVTVRGAGHQVPSYQPQRALSLITHFLSGTDLPLH